MGCEAVNELPGAKRRDVEDHLRLLGFKPARSVFPTPGQAGFMYFPENDYAFLAGVEATVIVDDGGVAVATRTRSWRSQADAEFQNRTIRELKRRFGGTFQSDRGANRYFQLQGPNRREAEAGAFRAFSIFEDNYASAGLYIQNMPVGDGKHRALPEVLRSVFPVVNASNMIVPFFVAITEEYLRSTYVALLRYSPRRDEVLRPIRMNAAEAAQVRDDGELLEEAVARTKMSFQNLQRVQSQFKTLNSKYDVAGWLRQPYRRRKETLYDTLTRLVEQRHALVHRAVILNAYDNADADRDLKSIGAAVTRIYSAFVELHGWSAEAG